jgi:hypothetical protein
MDCDITIDFFRSEEQERRTREIFEPLRILLPRWLQSLQLAKVQQGDNDTIMEVVSSHPYRDARINIYDRFFAMKAEEQREVAIHEILHIHHEPVDDYARTRLIEYAKSQNEDLAITFDKEYTDRMEGFVQDLSHLIDGLLPKRTTPKERKYTCGMCGAKTNDIFTGLKDLVCQDCQKKEPLQ